MSEDELNRGAELFLAEMAGAGCQQVTVAGRVLRPGSRVRLRPGLGGDIIDLALAGKCAVIEGIDEDDTGIAHVAVVLEDDPGRDLGELRHPAHRFFFKPSELEALEDQDVMQPGEVKVANDNEDGAEQRQGSHEPVQRRVLVAGIGNVFFGDDGFGVAVANRLLGRTMAAGVEVTDFGIRGIDLAYALGSGYDAAILVDAVPRGGEPGCIYLMEPDSVGGEPPEFDSHQLHPLAVLGLARQLGELPPQLLIVGCEPEPNRGRDESMSMDMSPAVAAAVARAAEVVADLATRLASSSSPDAGGDPRGGEGAIV